MARPDTSLCSELAALLRMTASRVEHPASVETIETPVSWLMLVDRFAYKLKKPIHFDLMDFRTLDQRKRACASEIRLNQPLAADVYIDAVPITRDSSGAVRLGGSGPAVDWVVKMRRLPADRSLAHLIRQGAVTECDAANVARVVAGFYASRPPLCVRPDDYLKSLAERMDDNLRTLAAVRGADWAQDLRSIHAAQRRFLALFADVVDRRVCDGRIVDGHGDLCPEHIYVESPPVAIDCLEGPDSLRQVDVADELALLSMECDRLGADWVGQHIVTACCQATRDDPPQVLLDFYRGHRAVTRARVTALQIAQQSAPDDAEAGALVHAYLDLARRYLRPLSTPILLVVGGLMGTGKSTIAEGLGESLGIDRLRTDEMRRELLGTGDDRAAYESGSYPSDLRHKVYERLLLRADELLRTGHSVVLDGTFLTNFWRDRAMQLAHRHGALPLLVACQCPRDVALARLDRRTDDGPATSTAWPELYDRQSGQQEPIGNRVPIVPVDTTVALNRQLANVTKRLRVELAAAGVLAARYCP